MVWADTVQSFVMFAGIVSASIKATVDVGGVNRVVEAVERGQRNTLWKYELRVKLQLVLTMVSDI